nr:immunoglobulin heavy chain junction region [Mus musculus]MBK4196504.1 immunoglobulin heavy chain junction region [Mus musculus]
CASPNYW